MQTKIVQTKTLAAVYARTSSEDVTAGDKVSIDVQIAKCKDLATKQGLDVALIEQDRDQSGSLWADVPARLLDPKASPRTRPGWTRVVNALQSGEIGTLIVYDTTRVARPSSRTYSAWILDLLEGVRVITCDRGEVDFSNVATDLMETINHKLLRAEIDRNTQKSIASKAKKAAEGMLVGPPLFGYRSAGSQRVELIPEHVETIRRMFDLWTNERKGSFSIAKILTAEGRTTQKGKNWGPSQIHAFIHNPVYIGKYVAPDGTLQPSKVYQPIISEEQWLTAQAIHRENKQYQHKGKDYKRDFWLQSMLTCTCCGSPMRVTTGNIGWGGNRHMGHFYYCRNLKCTGRSSILCEELQSLMSVIVEKFDAHYDTMGGFALFRERIEESILNRLALAEREKDRLAM
jgi:DNA invertase Pin-like site-specific DNA recombinase